ncbi:MAG: TIGR02391 family protein [Candidatus Poribacteria bacterium]|nr:TIGR02391 family protein [Candidatus Poribacteria bacterium]
MLSIYDLISDHQLLLNLETEELAFSILKCLHSFPSKERAKLNFKFLTSPYMLEDYPNEHHNEIVRALMEAWAWLKNEGLIVPIPGSDLDQVRITKKGENVKDNNALEAYKKAKLLPKQLLHSSIAEDIWSNFSRGKYDTAIFEAFKAVEIAVRNTGGYTAADYGVDLMRKAFHVQNGPLTDQNQLKPEREATAHLFAGAIGLYKNPQSHRNVSVTAEEAVEIIMFASHLLRIVDSRV